MRKLMLLLGVGILLSTASSAQSYERPIGSEFSVGIEGALPMNGWDLYDGSTSSTKVSDFGIGATIKYAYNFNETIAATFQTGYVYFPGKDLGGGKINTSQIPIKAGVRFSMSRFYVEPQFGLSSLNVKVASTVDSGSYSGSTTAFTYAIGVGAMAGRNFDIGLRYEAMSKDGTMGFLALRLAYSLPFGR
ncbi:outer membrane beta-barrel protein [Arachidicoccus terrestris]|uniref:outer membrane beta-barrel protein n=1 Tax=Arachidicoccus terrestris TaxID=2875539 RepID=UPI001CC4E5C4|nr:outer membrane beta-barrel protein [Arachidicoccus terrestris]UAY54005.1 porin family protein [Arachidicoccus terrestris]